MLFGFEMMMEWFWWSLGYLIIIYIILEGIIIFMVAKYGDEGMKLLVFMILFLNIIYIFIMNIDYM